MELKNIYKKKFEKLLKKYEALSRHCDDLQHEVYSLKNKLNIKLDCIGIKPGKGKVSLP